MLLYCALLKGEFPMKNFFLTGLLALVGGSLSVLTFIDETHAATFTTFGPQDHLRSTKQPISVKDNFSVLNPNTSYILHGYNSGENNQFPKVSILVSSIFWNVYHESKYILAVDAFNSI